MYLLISIGSNISHLSFTGEYHYIMAYLFLAFWIVQLKG